MDLITDPANFYARCLSLRAAGSVGVVPTMGALHAGHMALVAASRRRDAATVATIFVNPTQFGPREDFARYPRQLQRDSELLREAGVQVVFAPAPEAMYAPDAQTRVDVGELATRLCGQSRPGHFAGVATIVLKLFHLAVPTRAYFGQKDAAQVAVLRRMVRDLNVAVELVVEPIVRDADGLALSSRNAYLNPEERRQALGLVTALRAVEAAVGTGPRGTVAGLEAGRQVLQAFPAVALEYLDAVHPDTLLPVPEILPGTLIAIAARVGKTRLIDNLVIAGGRVQETENPAAR
ncbi:MAG: pantoate--beta-alanine ligase [Terriglobales bacterium]